MDIFTDTFDLETLKTIEKQVKEKITADQTPEIIPPKKRKLRRSNTVDISSSFNYSVTSDGDVIEDSPTNSIVSLQSIREKIQKTLRLNNTKRPLKRNKSDGLIKKSKKFFEFQKSILDGENLEETYVPKDRGIENDETMEMSKSADKLQNDSNKVDQTSKLGSEVVKHFLEGSDFTILNKTNPNKEKELKKHKSEEMILSRYNSETPLPSSQEASLLNLPPISSQDLNLMKGTLDFESTKSEFLLEDEIDRKFDCDNITFTQSNVLHNFLEDEIKKCKDELKTSAENLNLVESFQISTKTKTLNTINFSRKSFQTEKPSIKLDETLNLKLISSWNLPKSVEKEYQNKGITEMFDWQVQCLNNSKVLFENRNLVYSAPTSAGKTLVSEILMIKTVLELRKKAILILPFVSVVREKMFYLQDLMNSSGIRVDGFFGGYTPPGGFDSTQISVCTIEKANSIINRLLEQNKLESIGMIVVDEIHLIGDPHRGYILELLLAKILFMTKRFQNIKIQIVTMSATLPKLELLSKWLDSEMFVTDFRPVELKEMIKIENTIYNNKLELIRSLDEKDVLPKDQDNVAQLCLETISEGCSVIIFCPNKDWCEKLSLSVAETIHHLWKIESELSVKLKSVIKTDQVEEVKSQLTLNCPTGLDEILGKAVTYGCSFHHAGLTTEERDIIESSFKNGSLKLIVATSTLSSGVNLPARRVIIRSPMFGGKIMNSLTYKQMIGRAGRTGKDTIGESFLICTEQNKKFGEELVCARLVNPITSCLVYKHSDGEVEYNMNNMKRAILEIIAAGVASTNNDLKLFVQSTLFYVEHSELFEDLNFDIVALKFLENAKKKKLKKHQDIDESQIMSTSNAILDCIDFLIDYEFIRIQVNEKEEIHFLSTRLGLACLASSLPPADGFLLFSELQRSRQCFVLESELHAIYLVTPYSVCNQLNDIDWLLFLDMWEKLAPPLQRVGELVGIRDSHIVKAMRGLKKLDYKLMQIHKRFFVALALQELVNEVPISQVAVNFKVHRGLLQSLQQMAGTFAGIVTSFCNSLNWTMLSVIVSQFKDRLYFGIQNDLMDLMRIASLNSQRARALYKNGIETLLDLAQTNQFEIERILYDLSEFQTEKKQDHENEFEVMERNKIRNFFVTGKIGLTVREGSELIITEARQFLEIEMGLTGINWETNLGDLDKNKNGLKRHSTEEFLDDKIENKREKKNDDSFETKFSEDLFKLSQSPSNLEPVKKATVKRSNAIYSKAVQNEVEDLTDTEEDDESAQEDEFFNKSQLFDCEKEEGNGCSYDSINIIDVCESYDLFNKFKSFVLNQKNTKPICMSIGVANASISTENRQEQMIGGNIFGCRTKSKCNETESQLLIDSNRIIAGMSFCFEGNNAFYVDFQSNSKVPFNSKVDLIQQIFQSARIIALYDAKEQLKILLKTIPKIVIDSSVQFEDPKIANWLLFSQSSDNDSNSLMEMAERHAPECCDLVDILCYDFDKDIFGIGICGNNPIPVHIRVSIESSVVRQILIYQKKGLENLNLLDVFKHVEMPIQISLVYMELSGITVGSNRLMSLVQNMKLLVNSIEHDIYKTYGHRFNLRSSKDLCRVLKLNGKERATKSVLESLNTPLSSLILQYRKLGGILNKMVYPMSRIIKDGKIYSKNISFTATGRINMLEPSIQTIAKDFEIYSQSQKHVVSLRNIFQPSVPERCFISADFCQLELRILTHFSEDKALLKIMKSNQDVFQAIAAKWNKISEKQVTETLRHDTKQICYGIIYGMGVKSLSLALQIDELEAASRVTEFHKTYPGLRMFIDNLLSDVQERGFVETLSGRRRYFPHLIKSEHNIVDCRTKAIRAQQERQAVNTKIQGSAADILKAAILKVEENLRKYKKVLKLKQASELAITDFDDNRTDLVLHLHDELMYEIPKDRLKHFAKMLKSSMESAFPLKIPLKVKLRSGPSWGEQEEIFL